MNRLENRVAVVSGACHLEDIGGATALRLAREGARVVVADIDADGAERLATAINEMGGQAVSRRVDLNDEDSIKALFTSVIEVFGSVDILHNNAAFTSLEQMGADMAIEAMDPDVWDRAFHANARGTMLMIKHVLPSMLKAGGGSIINTSSGASLRGDFYGPAYAASKAAINCLSQYVATQYGSRNIRCNVVSPGLILTAKAKSANTQEQLDRIRSHSLTPQLGQPEDIAAAVAYLASDDAKFVTGQIMAIDGGYISHMPHTGENLANFMASPTGRTV
ncbi:MAG: dehydrogenase [Porticoccaceae bacterium]|nr:dehydrogenase [Porticoccaceae bacterium]